MTDIVRQLKVRATSTTHRTYTDRMAMEDKKAAAEIERLRAELAAAQRPAGAGALSVETIARTAAGKLRIRVLDERGKECDGALTREPPPATVEAVARIMREEIAVAYDKATPYVHGIADAARAIAALPPASPDTSWRTGAEAVLAQLSEELAADIRRDLALSPDTGRLSPEEVREACRKIAADAARTEHVNANFRAAGRWIEKCIAALPLSRPPAEQETRREREAVQHPGWVPGAICYDCGLGRRCHNPKCPNEGRAFMISSATDTALLRSLADRCEAANRPDRELDGLVHSIGVARAFTDVGGYWLRADGSAPSRGMGRFVEAPRYTASLDAAVALCERMLPGEGYIIDTTEQPLQAGVGAGGKFPSTGACPALALTAAVLRALAAQIGEGR